MERVEIEIEVHVYIGERNYMRGKVLGLSSAITI